MKKSEIEEMNRLRAAVDRLTHEKSVVVAHNHTLHAQVADLKSQKTALLEALAVFRSPK
jgi:peptidoglycan hydrolase CwlO-like protein